MAKQFPKGWDPELVSRGTKCFGCESESKYPGSYPIGLLKWIQKMGWWGDRRIHLCAGGVKDLDSDRVDIQQLCKPGTEYGHRKGRTEFKTTANIIADARDTGLEADSYDWAMVDPPYSADLAFQLYDTKSHFSGINKFITEAYRLVKPGGFAISFSYMPPKRPGNDAQLAACWGIYQNPPVRHMTCLSVWRKPGKRDLQGLEKWMQEGEN